MEAARRASIVDENARKIRVVELAAGACSSRDVQTARTTNDSVVAYEKTTKGVQSTEVVDSGEPKPPTC